MLAVASILWGVKTQTGAVSANPQLIESHECLLIHDHLHGNLLLFKAEISAMCVVSAMINLLITVR